MQNNKEDESYLNFVTQKIELDKLLYNLPKDEQDMVKELIDKRNYLRKSNTLLAEFKINRINKKINKISKKYLKN